ncbi:hypothetical protein EDB19DRAFT_1835433 [Suillus lakei]|nr:hypothetical protein EDB19DRAFT_1835433 [Suillus lakei]
MTRIMTIVVIMADGDSWNQVREALASIKLFDQLRPTGEDTPTEARLEQLIEMYLPFIDHPSSTHEPISIIVITDGTASKVYCDASSRLPVALTGSRFLSRKLVFNSSRSAQIQMPQVLDDELPDRYKIRTLQDIVDATPFDPANGAFNTDYMTMTLIGSLHKELDNGTAELLSSERKPVYLPTSGLRA